MTIFFDMDGTWIDLYGVKNWLDYLKKEDPYPYIQAKPLVDLHSFEHCLHKLQAKGIKIGIISWLSKNSNDSYKKAVVTAKMEYIKNYLPTVIFDEIYIIDYGTPKSSCISNKNNILFDDEESNRKEWTGIAAYDEKDLIFQLEKFLQLIKIDINGRMGFNKE